MLTDDVFVSFGGVTAASRHLLRCFVKQFCFKRNGKIILDQIFLETVKSAHNDTQQS